MLITPILLDCIPHWMKRYFDPDADPLDLSNATTAPGRRSSMYTSMHRRSSMFIPPWQAEEDPLNLSGHSTVPGRRSSVYEPSVLVPDARRSSILPPVVEPIPDAPEIIRIDRSEYYTGEEPLRRQRKVLPSHSNRIQALTEADETHTDHLIPREVKRSWPEPGQKGERRIVSSNYAAVEIHGFFGLIDDGSTGEGRMLIVHVPSWIRGYFLDIKQGDTLHVYHATGKKVGGILTVLSTGRHKYYAPGRRVTTCTVCVPEEQWAPFSL